MLELNLLSKKAILFDCDGTLADTMEAHKAAYRIAFELNSLYFDEEAFDEFAPFGGRILLDELLGKKGFKNLINQIVLDKEELLLICLKKFMKPNTELVNFIKDNNERYHIGVVSNGRKKNIETILKQLGILYDIKCLVTSDILGCPKPSPEAYNYAMLRLCVEPKDVIVFEDNKVGFDAATAAGIKDIIMVKI